MPLSEVGGGTILSGVVLLRRPGREPFDSRDRSLVHILFGECGGLHVDGLDVDLLEPLDQITPRQRAVLAMLIEGLSIPAAAEQLGLSPHTVKGYTKVIYEHFGVSDRAGLIRRFNTA